MTMTKPLGTQIDFSSGDLSIDTNTLHVDSTNNRVGIGTSSPSQKLHVVGEVFSNDRIRGESFLSTGGGISKSFSTSWTTLFTLPSNTDKSLWAKMRAYNTENGATSHFTFYFSAVIRHNGTPYGNFYNFSYTADANLQSASGSTYAQFRFTDNGVANGNLYFQGYNTTFGNVIYFYEIDAVGYDHIVW